MATTMIEVSLSATTSLTGTPPSVTIDALFPPPSSLDPWIVTRVPTWPLLGLTVEMLPRKSQVHPFTSDTIAPESEMTTTSPLPMPSVPATTSIRVSLRAPPIAKATATPPNVTDATALPPPSNLAPTIAARVPYCPELGST